MILSEQVISFVFCFVWGFVYYFLFNKFKRFLCYSKHKLLYNILFNFILSICFFNGDYSGYSIYSSIIVSLSVQCVRFHPQVAVDAEVGTRHGNADAEHHDGGHDDEHHVRVDEVDQLWFVSH